MREIRPSGLMSGEGKRSDAAWPQATALFLDSTCPGCRSRGQSALMLAARITFPHLSVSSAISLLKSEVELA
jgi:hypothetical protein